MCVCERREGETLLLFVIFEKQYYKLTIMHSAVCMCKCVRMDTVHSCNDQYIVSGREGLGNTVISSHFDKRMTFETQIASC